MVGAPFSSPGGEPLMQEIDVESALLNLNQHHSLYSIKFAAPRLEDTSI